VPIPGAPATPGIRRPINNWTEAAATGAVLRRRMTGDSGGSPMTDVTDSGILTTASDVHHGGARATLGALDAKTGTLL
jgi:hypothetical protein